MLNLIDVDVCESPELVELVRDFRRVQVSRFPLDVWFRQHSVVFTDSRFKEDNEVSRVYRDFNAKGRPFWVFDCRLIHNDRFANHNPRRHQKHSDDIKKMLKHLRTYTMPFTGKEISKRSNDVYFEGVQTWRWDGKTKMVAACRMEREDVMDELVRMKAMGYIPHNEKIRKAMDEGVDAWAEHLRRETRKCMAVHVYINPDESVEIFCDDSVGYAGISKGSTYFPSLENTPMCIQQHVSMLRMMDDKSFVPEVGTKVRDNVYWVEVHPE